VGRLIYIENPSLDGYLEDAQGGFGWSRPSEEVHRFINDLIRGLGTHLYGRRMYETLAPWETDPSLAALSDYTADFAEIWQAAEKIVYSGSLETAPTQRTRLERRFEPEAVRRMKEAAERDLTVGGPALAAEAFGAGLVDECHLFLNPVAVGGGKRAFPRDLRLELELLDERRFGGGVVHLHYRVSGSS
jgi:dihydrofolate reductase